VRRGRTMGARLRGLLRVWVALAWGVTVEILHLADSQDFISTAAGGGFNASRGKDSSRLRLDPSLRSG
jgi:hypothetical protein